jgi:hypothetical protein
MATGTSSARYTDLYSYAGAAEQIDHDLIVQADRLITRLSYFEATCREPGFQVSSDGLGSALRSYGVHNLPIDGSVRIVGQAFQSADAFWRPATTPSLPGWARTVKYVTREIADWWKWTAALAYIPAYWAMTWVPEAGEMVVKGPQLAREVLGLSPKLSHIKLSNLGRHLTKESLKFKVGAWVLIGIAIESAERWMVDIEEYRGDLIRTINAITIDTAVIVVLEGLAGVLVVIIGGIIAGTTAPAWVVFLIIAGVGIGVGYALDWGVLDPFFNSDFRLDAIEFLTDKEFDLVNYLDARVHELLMEKVSPIPMPGPPPQPHPAPLRSVGINVEVKTDSTQGQIPHLSQKNPQGDIILDFSRYENPSGSGKREFEPGIVTVRDHIAMYGCLITDYAMLLKGKGFNTEVTDLYRAKAEKEGSIDTENKSVVLFDLYTGPKVANDYLENEGINARVEKGYLAGSTVSEKVESLKERVQTTGPIILHVKGDPTDGHWIVVSHINVDGSVVVLDPLKDLPSVLSEYELFGDDEFQFLNDVPAI